MTRYHSNLGRLFGLRDSPYVPMLLDDGLVSEDFIHSKYFRIYQELRLGVHSVVLESSDDVFPLVLPFVLISGSQEDTT